MADLILFDDGDQSLAPLTDLRPSFALRSGALCTFERVARQLGKAPAALRVPPTMSGCVADVCKPLACPVNGAPPSDDNLLLNGRWTSINQSLPDHRNSAIVDGDGSVIAARLDRSIAKAFFESSCGVLPSGVTKTTVPDAGMLSRPWHILRRSYENLGADLKALGGGYGTLKSDRDVCVTVVGEHPVHAAKGVVVHPNVVFDTSAGPIVLAESVVVRSISVMVGPAYVGPHSVVCNHAHIRAGTVIGPHCKVGGEVNGCIFQGYSNKAHSGFLGNSYVGEWVNLGADTVTSNLKNTYGEVRMRCAPAGPEEPTGTQFLGSVIGDHVKTAIGTRLPTGCCVHTGAMLAMSGFAPKYVERFAFLTDGAAEKYAWDKFRDTVVKVMRRREMEPSPAMLQRLQQLHAR